MKKIKKFILEKLGITAEMQLVAENMKISINYKEFVTKAIELDPLVRIVIMENITKNNKDYLTMKVTGWDSKQLRQAKFAAYLTEDGFKRVVKQFEISDAEWEQIWKTHEKRVKRSKKSSATK